MADEVMRRMRIGAVCAMLLLAEVGVGLAAPAPQGFMHGASQDARSIAQFGAVVLVIFSVGAAVMWALLAWIVSRRRGSFAEHAHVATDDGKRWVVIGGLAIPTVVFFALFGLMFGSMGASSMHPGNQASRLPDIRLTGRQWWFDAEYLVGQPQGNVHVPTEIHIPVSRTVEIELVSRDVIHSFWVPRLQGKVDLVPGTTNRVTLRADRPGVYDGECAEFCGVQHAQMRLVVVAQPEAEFRKWLATQRESATVAEAGAATRHGEEVFMNSACPLCHTVRGTNARGQFGPDLTHVGARRRIAGGAFLNDTANLAAWITDAQSMKPGSQMPTLRQLQGDDLRAVVAYLQGLQ